MKRMVYKDTLDGLVATRKEFRSLRALGAHLGINHATLSDILRNRSASLSMENTLRERLGMPLIGIGSAEVCPCCGVIHVGKCPNVAPPRSRRRVYRPVLSLEMRKRIKKDGRSIVELLDNALSHE